MQVQLSSFVYKGGDLNAFALLKERFRHLRYIEFTSVDKITQFIIACCVLHNICLNSGDTGVEHLLTEDEREEIGQDALLQIIEKGAELDQNRQPQTNRESVLRRLRELKRDTLMRQVGIIAKEVLLYMYVDIHRQARVQGMLSSCVCFCSKVFQCSNVVPVQFNHLQMTFFSPFFPCILLASRS
ncbi:hypothetical protein HPB48_004611 [Haemaphysalis longicornis]|uniref:DDE Tnp4 domain-containing protein n=1 Tax=Haemaphysalis longicornis TaxID=44386 RepID=A0A9J6GB63_HAELO|nr:hypothetical protein HPB48_004611 [Haemaphysalis longicornis]